MDAGKRARGFPRGYRLESARWNEEKGGRDYSNGPSGAWGPTSRTLTKGGGSGVCDERRLRYRHRAIESHRGILVFCYRPGTSEVCHLEDR